MDEGRMRWWDGERHLTVFERERVKLGKCMADSDGDCYWSGCPQAAEHTRSCPRWRKDEVGRGGG